MFLQIALFVLTTFLAVSVSSLRSLLGIVLDQQYRPELLPQEAAEEHAVPMTEEQQTMTETLDRLKKIETALGIKE